jgi:hypothetical protein
MQQRLQERLQQPLSEEPKNAQPIIGKDLFWWRFKRLFWGRNSITAATLIYGVSWFGLVYSTVYLLQALHINPGDNSQWGRLACVIFLAFGIPSLLSAYITAKISPKWSTLAVGLVSGGFIGYFAREIVRGIRDGDSSSSISIIVLLLSNICAFLLARKIRNKHYAIVKPKRNRE